MIASRGTPTGDDDGFSLIEVLVAFVILALALGVLLPSLSQISARPGDANRQLIATEIAVSEMARLGVEIPIEVGTVQGKWRDYRWQIRVDEANDMNSPDSRRFGMLLEIEINVHRVGGSVDEPIARLVTLRRVTGRP